MMQPQDITVSQVAIRQARSLGFRGSDKSVAQRLQSLCAVSVDTEDHEMGNRAHGDFVLLMQGKHLEAVTHIGPVIEDHRPPSQCDLCGGLMMRRVTTLLDGREGVTARPCPRALDPTAPLCDTWSKP